MLRNFGAGLICIITSIILAGCSDETTSYDPIPFQWTTVMESSTFGFRKIWDLHTNNDNVPLRIASINQNFGNVFFYNPDSNNSGEGDTIPYSATGKIYDVSGMNASNIWCAANRDNGKGNIYLFNGTSDTDALENFGERVFGASDMIDQKLWGVCVFDDRNTGKEVRIFVGDNGYVVHFEEDSGTATGNATLKHWHDYSIPAAPDLRSVWGVDMSNLWAVGSLGQIYKYDGSYNWIKVADGLTSYNLYDIHGFSRGLTVYWYAVGENGEMIYYDGANIDVVDGLPNTADDLHSIFMRSATAGIAVGEYGYILELGTNGWTQTQDVTNRDCFSCFISKDLKNKYITTSNDTTWEGTLIRYFDP